MASSLPTSHSLDITGACVTDTHSLPGILPEIVRPEPRSASVAEIRKGSNASIVPTGLDVFYGKFQLYLWRIL